MVQVSIEPIFRNFVREEPKEIILRHWQLYKNKYVETSDELIFFFLKNESIEERVNLRAFLSHLRASETDFNELNNSDRHARVVIVSENPSIFFNFYGWEEDVVFCYCLKDGEKSMKHLVNRLMQYPYQKIHQ